MKTMNKIIPLTEDRLSHLLTNSIQSSFFANWAINAGTEISADANITGITPAELILNGRYDCFLCTVLLLLFAY